jgi:hypothetical protein
MEEIDPGRSQTAQMPREANIRIPADAADGIRDGSDTGWLS